MLTRNVRVFKVTYDTRILKKIKGQNGDLDGIILSRKFLEYRNEAQIYLQAFY